MTRLVLEAGVKVLVAVDPSASFEHILTSALDRPWPTSTSFTVLNVVNLQAFEKLPALIEAATREGLLLAKTAADRLAAAGHQACALALPGHPRGEISSYAREWGAGLILVGSHGHTGIGRILLGSVAQGVLRTAPCSVEIVRLGPRAKPGGLGTKILLATDGSACSVNAAHVVANGPWPQGAVFRVLSVEELMVVANQIEAASSAAIYPASQLALLAELAHERAKSAVEEAKAILIGAGRQVLDTATPIGDPRRSIVEAAREWPADLIVLGSHGRRGFDRFLLGSVSESVAIHAHCSVRVIRTAQAEANHH